MRKVFLKMRLVKKERLLTEYLWNTSSIFYVEAKRDGSIKRANAFAEKLFGKKLIGMPLEEVFINFDKEKDIFGYFSKQGEKTLLHINTEKSVPISFYFRFYISGGDFIAIGESDNSEVEMFRNNILELNNELNNLTRDLHKKNAELKKINEQKNRVLGIAAHDLRSPVANIKIISDLLLERLNGLVEVDYLELVGHVYSSSKFILKLLNDLLDISAIESGKLELNYEATNIKDLIEYNVKLNSNLAGKKRIELVFNSDEVVPKIMVDRIKIEQVLNNLLSNAVKFSFPESKINVNLRVDDNFVTVSVSDRGQGIPEHELDKIFKPFDKSSVKATHGEKTTGLGLAIVWNIIKGHKGKIWVESEVGNGATFHFKLPLNVKVNQTFSYG